MPDITQSEEIINLKCDDKKEESDSTDECSIVSINNSSESIKFANGSCKVTNSKNNETDSINLTKAVDNSDDIIGGFSDIESPIKIKKKNCNLLNDDSNSELDSEEQNLAELDTFNNASLIDIKEKLFSQKLLNKDSSNGNELNNPETDSDTDSPIKLKRKFRRFSEDEDELISNKNTLTDVEKTNADIDKINISDFSSKLKTKFSDELFKDKDELPSPMDSLGKAASDLSTEAKPLYSNELWNLENKLVDNKIGDLTTEESLENVLNESRNTNSDDDSPVKTPRSSFMRDLKGKDLVKQTVSLPYFQLPKPDFREYMNETNRRLEEPLLDISSSSTLNTKISKKITLKPSNNIVFEFGPSKMDKVEPFRQKVLNMLSRNAGSKSESTDKADKSIPKCIGAERLSWKMKLLNDIAKKKEAALKERNEMLEEALEIDEGENHIESEIEDFTEDDDVDINLPLTETLATTADIDEQDSLPELTIDQNSDNSILLDNNNKVSEIDKGIECSPLCFSLPSFQPEGGFTRSVDLSTSNVSLVSEANLSFNDNESQKELQSLSLFGSVDLLSSNPLPPMSQNDEIVYDKVLAKENLLSKDHNISRDMITADVLDICSGQFPDTQELPKTPPLIQVSAYEDSDADVSDNDNCPVDQPEIESDSGSEDDLQFKRKNTIEHISEKNDHQESDSDSEDDLKFKRKVIKKKIRPISPIDEESRYGEEDTQLHPASVLVESSFNFNKNTSEPIPSSEDEEAGVNQLSLVYNSDEELEEIEKDQKTSRHVRDFFENEAELSGEEGSSDEDERDLDGEDPLVLEDANLPENEELRDQIGTLHLKHLLDDDDQMIRKVKDHFLEDGELFSDAARQRKFNWSFNQVENIQNPNASDSDNEEEISETPFHEDKLKWMQENGNQENNDEIAEETFDTSFKVGVRKKIATQIIAERLTNSFNKRPRNSFMGEEDAKKSFKKMKLDVTNAQGSRVTKNFVFVEAKGSGPVKKKISSHKSSIDNSVFDVI